MDSRNIADQRDTKHGPVLAITVLKAPPEIQMCYVPSKAAEYKSNDEKVNPHFIAPSFMFTARGTRVIPSIEAQAFAFLFQLEKKLKLKQTTRPNIFEVSSLFSDFLKQIYDTHIIINFYYFIEKQFKHFNHYPGLNTVFCKMAKQRILELDIKDLENKIIRSYSQATMVFLNTSRHYNTIFSTASKDIYDLIHVENDLRRAKQAYQKQEFKLIDEIKELSDFVKNNYAVKSTCVWMMAK